MKVSWTPEQLNSIYATNGSILVSAAAGSGKTAVLAERVINLISRENNPIDIDRLLIVTFTRAAATEMKERIIRNIDRLLSDDPYNPNLLRQKQLAYKANISTIDSFCSNIVREYFHALDISSDYRNADNGELEIMQKQAMENAFEKFYSNGDKGFVALLDAFSDTKGDEKLKNAVLQINGFLSTQPFPEQWMDKMLKAYDNLSVPKSVWGQIVINHVESLLMHAVTLTELSLKLLDSDPALKEMSSGYHEADMQFLNGLSEKIQTCDWDEISAHISGYKFASYRVPNSYTDYPLKVENANRRNEVKKITNKISSYFTMSEEEIRTEFSEVKAVTASLFDLVNEFRKQFSEIKAKKNVLSFSDVEQLAVKLLAKSDNNGEYVRTQQAIEISKRFSMVIVDEFQDVNDVQNLIFNCVSNNESNLFVVGDVKQSIYSFRQAKPQIFIDRKNKYSKYNSEQDNYPATIVLDKNFRSREEVCETVNYIFSFLMQKNICGMDYTAEERLNAGTEYQKSSDCEFDIALIEENDFESENKIEVEARYIAQKIHKMIHSDGFTVKDGSQTRKATYGDFAILLRKTKGLATKYVKGLNEFGIPAFCEESESVFEAQEVKILLNFLKVIDNPSLEIELLSILVSPIYGFTPDELAQIRSDSRKMNLYASLKLHAEANNKVHAFLTELDNLRSYSGTCSVDELIGKILEVTAFGAITSAVVGGNSPLQNLNLIRFYARNFEKNGYKTLSDFNNYINRLIDCGQELQSAQSVNSESLNGVRIISIHKSKGLEFPVCILANSGHNFNFDDLKKNVAIDSKTGLGLKKKVGICRYKTFSRLAVELELKKNVIAEEMRVLYVALTRAKEKLIMVSTKKDWAKHIEKLNSNLPFDSFIEPYAISNCESMSDWIITTALLNQNSVDLREHFHILDRNYKEGLSYPKWNFEFVENLSNTNNQAELGINARSQMTSEKHNVTEKDYSEILRKNLSFEYRNKAILNLPQKVSASQIAHNGNSSYFEKVISKPKFLSQKVSLGIEKGTAHHLFLQYCDFLSAKNNIESEINRLVQDNRITQQQADCIDKENILKLLNTELFERIIASDNVMREEQFTVKVSASVAFDNYIDTNSNPDIIMQGAVDLAFVENGKLVIVDYKTDRVGDISKLAELYKKQLLLYKNAMEQSTEYEVKELIICSVYLNSYILVSN